MEQAVLTRSVRLEMAIEAEQDVEHGDDVSQTSLKMMTRAMKDLLQATGGGDQRERGFDQHALVPGTAWTELEIGRDAISVIETGVGQDNALVLQRFDEGQKHLVMDVGGVPGPTDDLTRVVEQPAQLQADDPAPIAFAFLAHLLGTAAFTDRVDQLDAIAVNDSEEGRGRQEVSAPVLMSCQLALQAGAVWQAAKQRGVVTRYPAVEGAEISPLQRKQHAEGYHFAWVQLGLAVFRYHRHVIIYPTEQFDDKVLGGHGSYLQQFGDYRLYEIRDLFSTSTNG